MYKAFLTRVENCTLEFTNEEYLKDCEEYGEMSLEDYVLQIADWLFQPDTTDLYVDSIVEE